MRDERHKRMVEIEDTYTAHAFANRYHPVRDYFQSLTWDGQPHIANLTGYFTDKHNILSTYLRRWLIGAVARAFDQTQNFMLILDGPQGCGKSHFAEWLCPLSLKFYAVTGAVNPRDKDAWLRLSDKWLWEVGELGGTMRIADRDALKDFVSHLTVTVRRPYAKYDVVRPALASLIGTVNGASAGLLDDATGSRRYAVVELTALDWGYTTAIPIDQVWAEAFTAYQAGESWKLTAAEQARQMAINEEYEVESPLEGLFFKYYTIDLTDMTAWISGIDIITELEVMGLKIQPQRRALSELGTMLKKYNIERKKRGQVRGYIGVSRKAPGVVI